MGLSADKFENMKALATPDGIIAAIAIDQRNSLRRPIAMFRGVAPESIPDEMLSEFKAAVSRVLTPLASAVLVDPEYGMRAAAERAPGAGLLLTYEADGFENPRPNRMLALLPNLSAHRLKQSGANGVKILLSYTPFDDPAANDAKHAMIERIGNECDGAGIPFLLEFVGYDPKGCSESDFEFAKLKPEIVIQSMQEFSNDRYKVDLMKVQVPVNAEFVEGSCVYKGHKAYSYSEALDLFRRAAEVATRPFIYLSAGVGHQQFIESLRMASEAETGFCGVLCGRATWNGGVPVYAKHGLAGLEDWLANKGIENMQALNRALQGARPWFQDRRDLIASLTE